MVECTKYISIKKCLQCWYDNESSSSSCKQCGYFFLEEASPEETAQAYGRWDSLKEKAKKEAKDLNTQYI